MKTFFSALILGIFIGSIITAYWSSPESFENLKASKNELLGQTEEINEDADQAPVEEPKEQPSAESASTAPMFKVATPEKAKETELAPTPPITPATPLDKPKDSPEKKPENQTPAEPVPEKSPIDRGKEKAAEIAEFAEEKAAELQEKAKPYLNEGVDLAIASAIRAQFKIDKRIDSDQLTIDVSNREVTLGGTVPSGEIEQLVIEIAMTTKGVTQVTTKLAIAE